MGRSRSRWSRRSTPTRYLLPLLRPGQRLFVVPGMYGPNSTAANAAVIAHHDELVQQKLGGYLGWAAAEPRIRGMFFWPSALGHA